VVLKVKSTDHTVNISQELVREVKPHTQVWDIHRTPSVLCGSLRDSTLNSLTVGQQKKKNKKAHGRTQGLSPCGEILSGKYALGRELRRMA
jgi:hypothetical protein